MAISIGMTSSTFLRDAAANLGFDAVRAYEDIGSDSMVVEARIGNQVYASRIANAKVQSAPGRDGVLMMVGKELRKMARQADHSNDHVMDLRYNSIESMDDFMALLRKAQEQNRRIDEAWITPEQKQTLLQQVDSTMLSSPDGQIVQLVGCKLRVEPQP